ncbi:MAG: Nif3-like dinuclear metal center hexameric protein [Balneolales bacterium]|nr:Nif3-like dinuclear metal center hexameric protein [Balneolales bacterium]
MSIRVREIADFLERWAPNAARMDYDNTGLLVGSENNPIKAILTCLDVTPDVIEEAESINANLIIAHHPLIFSGLKSVVSSDPVGSMVQSLIRKDISLIASHTNLDSVTNGVSEVLARRLNLQNTYFLQARNGSMVRVCLRLPNPMRDSMQAILGEFHVAQSWVSMESNVVMVQFNYDHHFLNPLKKAIHKELNGAPYELDVIKLESESIKLGFGRVGFLPEPMPAQKFLELVSTKLEANSIRCSGKLSGDIHKVAVCGGSGASLIKQAIRSGADAYVTADIKYHDFFVPTDFLLVDAGHYETEFAIAGILKDQLKQEFPEIPVFETKHNTNPVKHFQASFASNSIKQVL